jgi:hypothetical protein
MGAELSSLVAVLLKASGVLLLINEIRGLILAAPVLVVMYESGGTLTALWLGFSSLLGIALSVFVPMVAARKLLAKQRTALPA